MSGVTPELAERWRKMGLWEYAQQLVENREWELDRAKKNLKLAKKNLKDAQAKEAKARAALGPLSVLESAC